MAEPKISVVINGKPRQIHVGCSIKTLLEELEMQHAAIAVEINAEIRPSSEFEATTLREADQIEIVSLVGGG